MFNHAECLTCNFASVLDPGREAGGSGLIPYTKAGGAREFTDFLLGESGIAERGGHPVLFSGPLTRTEVALVIEVHAICDGVEAPASSEFFHDREQLVLAMKTS